MFPIRDHNPSERRPFITFALLAVNTVIFLYMWPLYGSAEASQVFIDYGMIPQRLSLGLSPETLITSMFLHGGFMHFAGNMLFLWIFGDNLEDMLGHVRFLLFYLATGIAAALLQYTTDPSSTIPMIGASGAIAGVMGGYLLLFPKAKIDVLFIIVIIFKIIPIPAWAALLVWFGLQLFNGVASFGMDGDGVAHWAHAGGFIAGLALITPLWLRLGAQRFWSRTDGHPDHPEAKYKLSRSSIPRTRRHKR
ncbi:Rhomboid protease GluP [Aliiroseovarius pelagivivens]|uniref:Rhomboid protease GluP n=1 Tax=Aliiroseovarius pelagivivens TaxID=1639690 RepID=A0A2R8ALR5_9RHOB|nr:rhomboid family intramembrane serine protease [Aliiroseovarius pelagivivens]SPF76978.1 Rhomboid protease GluP [Aliiroseovarius pelagivivens]